MSPTGRAAICAVIESPFAAAALISASVWRQRSGARSFWVIENEIGHLVFSATRNIIGRSSCSVERSSTNCSTLRPSLCMAAAIAVSAAIAHHRGRDAVLRGWRDVLTPGDLAVVMHVDVD